MKEHLLHPRHRRVLLRLLGPEAGPILLAFDYDGVLAPIISDPSGSHMSQLTRALLRELEHRFPLAVISGRSFAKLHRVVGTVAPYLVGNHGAEFLRRTPVPRAVLADVRRWEREMMERLGGVPGAELEHKHSTFAVHYGRAPDRVRAGRAVHGAARALQGVRLVPGKNMVNVLPAAFPTKGDAVRRLLRELGCRRALFVGDDVTDEDVFALGPRLVLGVHVGEGPTRARWRVSAREDVDTLLAVVLNLSRGRAAPHRPRLAAGDRG